MNRKQAQLAQVSSFFTPPPKSSESAKKRAMSVTIVPETNESGVIRPQRKKANVTGKKSCMIGKFHLLPVMMTGRFPRFISRLDCALSSVNYRPPCGIPVLKHVLMQTFLIRF